MNMIDAFFDAHPTFAFCAAIAAFAVIMYIGWRGALAAGQGEGSI